MGCFIALYYWQLGLVLVGLSSVLRDNHQGASQGQVVLGTSYIHAVTNITGVIYTVQCLYFKLQVVVNMWLIIKYYAKVMQTNF